MEAAKIGGQVGDVGDFGRYLKRSLNMHLDWGCMKLDVVASPGNCHERSLLVVHHALEYLVLALNVRFCTYFGQHILRFSHE
jgi:hypothetical protein